MIKAIGVAFLKKFNKYIPCYFDVLFETLPCFQMTSEVQLSISELQRLTSRYGSESARRTEDVGDEIDQIFLTLESHLSRAI